jgi:FAD synthase
MRASSFIHARRRKTMTPQTDTTWLTRLEDGLEQAKKHGKLVLLDFSAAPM